MQTGKLSLTACKAVSGIGTMPYLKFPEVSPMAWSGLWPDTYGRPGQYSGAAGCTRMPGGYMVHVVYMGACMMGVYEVAFLVSLL